MTTQIKFITYELFCPYCGFQDLVRSTTLIPSLPLRRCPVCREKMEIIEEEVSE